MSHRKQADVYQDLLQAGIPCAQALRIAAGAGKSGNPAGKFVAQNKDIVITREQQQALFNIDYPRYVKGDPSRQITGAEYWYAKFTKGFADALPWEQLNAPIRAVLVDLNYNAGHLDPDAVHSAMTNDYSLLISYLEALKDDPGTPAYLVRRDEQRIAYLEQYV